MSIKLNHHVTLLIAAALTVCPAPSLFAQKMSAAAGSNDDSPLLGVAAVTEPLPWFDSRKNYSAYDPDTISLAPSSTVAVTSLGRPPMREGIELRLSRYRYPAEDGHLDALLRFNMDHDTQPRGELEIKLIDADNAVVSSRKVSSIPGPQLHLSYRWPASFGDSGKLRAEWRHDGQEDVSTAEFVIDQAKNHPNGGRIPIVVPNPGGVVMRRVPISTGVPFPNGVLRSTDNLRLVTTEGVEIPMQCETTAKWARYGSLKWVRCSFELDLDGGERKLYMEYGPAVRRAQPPAIEAVSSGGFPTVDAGRVRIDGQGLWFDTGEDGFKLALEAGALRGAFVEHSDGAAYAGWGHHWLSSGGTMYTMPDAAVVVEEHGSERIVLRTEGWYRDEHSGKEFCKYLVRYILQRDSPLVRIFHTWIYTGDSNHDTIRNMGWRFPLADDVEPRGFLSALDESAEWRDGYYLRQHDYDNYALFEYNPPKMTDATRVREKVYTAARPIKQIGEGKRAPGIMAAQGTGVKVYVGVQDFWRNFPSSLMAEKDALTFYQWPRYGRERQHPVHAGDKSNVWRLWFAHEGETLNFRLPVAMTEAPIYVSESGPESNYAHGRPDSVNAQGIAKTAEMWIYLEADGGAEADGELERMKALSDDTLLAVVDPGWMTGSGAFYEAGAADMERYPEYEKAYAETVLNPIRQVERMGIYGKWIYGDLLTPANLDTLEGGHYRTFRKAHWGWPYSWLEFARSGSFAPRNFAMASTRMMTDTAFCHYVSPELAKFFDEKLSPRQIWVKAQPYRAIGWYEQNVIPWAGYWGTMTRCYCDEADYLWDAWHIAGYHRARDVALVWARETKREEPDRIMRGPITAGDNRGRWSVNLQKQYIEMYENTWDPWFLAAAQALAEMHIWRYRNEDNYRGHFWNAGHVTWQRYSGDPGHAEFLRSHIERETDLHYYGWAVQSTTIPATVFGYLSTGDSYYLRRAAGLADLLRWAHYNAKEPDYYRGFYMPGVVNSDLLYVGWQQIWYPWIIGIFNRAGGAPENPIYPPFHQTLKSDDRVLVVKRENEPLELRVQGQHTIAAPDGTAYAKGDAPVVVLPAEAAPGVYTLSLHGSVTFPISPVDTPEVYRPAGESAASAKSLMQYWFMVPEGTETFSVEFKNPGFLYQDIRQVVLWSPDGAEAWAWRQRNVDYDKSIESFKAEIEVKPEFTGRLWRLTQPSNYRTLPFKLSPNIPPLLSHDPTRWFDPALAAEKSQ